MKHINVLEVTATELENLIEKSVLKALISTNIPTSASDERDRLMNIQEVAKLLTLSVQTVYARVSRNEIPCMKKGKRLYFSEAEIKDWVRKGKRETIDEVDSSIDQFLSNSTKKRR